MVTSGTETKEKAECALQRIQELAAQGAVIYVGSRVQRHTDTFGYSFDAVCQCLSSLDSSDFDHAERYAANGHWVDVYLLAYLAPSGHTDSLYIKLSLDRDCVNVVVHSFHPEGAL